MPTNVSMSPISPTSLDDMCDWDNYAVALPKDEHDSLMMKDMVKLSISSRRGETTEEKSLESEIDPTVWEFVKLLSQKLDQNATQNLYRRLQSSTGTMIVSMLNNHKLKSTYDFEKAIAREWKLQQNLDPHRSSTGAI